MSSGHGVRWQVIGRADPLPAKDQLTSPTNFPFRDVSFLETQNNLDPMTIHPNIITHSAEIAGPPLHRPGIVLWNVPPRRPPLGLGPLGLVGRSKTLPSTSWGMLVTRKDRNRDALSGETSPHSPQRSKIISGMNLSPRRGSW